MLRYLKTGSFKPIKSIINIDLDLIKVFFKLTKVAIKFR